jgi:nicotinate-nucleotide adenylyltransferase
LPWPASQLREALKLPAGVELKMQAIDVPLIDIASRDLRRRVVEGRSIRYLVPRAVECFIEQHRLYQS